MPLKLRFRTNEGINIEEFENGERRSIDVVVRKIGFKEGLTNISFQIIEDMGDYKLELKATEKYDLTPRCMLEIPKKPLNEIEGRLSTTSVFLVYKAPREVVFSKKKLYQVE